MSKRTKRILIFSAIAFIIINTIFTIYIFTSDIKIGMKTGKYYYKITTVDNDGNKSNKWDISISNNDIKRDIEENEKNSVQLTEFRSIVEGISKGKVSIFYNAIFLALLLVIIFTTIIDKRKHIAKFDFVDIIFLLLSLFLIYKVLLTYWELTSFFENATSLYNIL